MLTLRCDSCRFVCLINNRFVIASAFLTNHTSLNCCHVVLKFDFTRMSNVKLKVLFHSSGAQNKVILILQVRLFHQKV